jgi:uncharacterized protein (DUF1778 family)
MMMAALMGRQKADSTISMRLSAQARELIDRAAAIVDKSRSEFVLESARQRAVDVLLDQRVFHLDEAASDAFARALEKPPAPAKALRLLMNSKPPWE